MKDPTKDKPAKLRRQAEAAANDSVVFLVAECDSDQELAGFNDALADAVARKPKQITLRFVGVHQMSPDAALFTHNTLLRKSPETQLITEAGSSLINGSVLIWLFGDVRRIRPTGWLYLRKREAKPNPMARPPWEEEPLMDCEQPFNLHDYDYGTVLRLISKFLPVQKLLGKPITPHILAEYCLLEGQCSEGLTAAQPKTSGALILGESEVSATQPTPRFEGI